MHYTHLSNASGKFVAPIITTPSLGLNLYGKKSEKVGGFFGDRISTFFLVSKYYFLFQILSTGQ